MRIESVQIKGKNGDFEITRRNKRVAVIRIGKEFRLFNCRHIGEIAELIDGDNSMDTDSLYEIFDILGIAKTF